MMQALASLTCAPLNCSVCRCSRHTKTWGIRILTARPLFRSSTHLGPLCLVVEHVTQRSRRRCVATGTRCRGTRCRGTRCRAIFSDGQIVSSTGFTLLTSASYKPTELSIYLVHCTPYYGCSPTSSIMAPSTITPSTFPDYNAPAGTIAAFLARGADLSSYFALFSVGTPPQKQWLLMDTGSPTISFFDSRGTFCKETTEPCTYYGAFDNLTSS
jgi:hypothetical protein